MSVLELWAQLFEENLGTCRLAIKLEETQTCSHIRLLIIAVRNFQYFPIPFELVFILKLD